MIVLAVSPIPVIMLVTAANIPVDPPPPSRSRKRCLGGKSMPWKKDDVIRGYNNLLASDVKADTLAHSESPRIGSWDAVKRSRILPLARGSGCIISPGS